MSEFENRNFPEPSEVPIGDNRALILANVILRKLDAFCEAGENRLGLAGGALVIGLLLMVAAAIYISPGTRPYIHGPYYAQMSENPFVSYADNPVQTRILSPLVAWVLHLRGNKYFLVPLLACLPLNAGIYYYFRRQQISRLAAAAIAGLCAFSSPTLFQIQFPGANDGVSHLLLFLMFASAARPIIWAPLFMLALFNHESMALFAPVILAFHFRGRPSASRLFVGIVALGLAAIAPLMVKHYIERHASGTFTPGYYLSLASIKENFAVTYRLGPMGAFMAFKALWCLPVIAIPLALGARRYLDALCLFLPIFCACLELVVAHDTTRLMGFAWPSIIFSAAYLYTLVQDRERFARQLWGLIALTCLVPQYFIFNTWVESTSPVPVQLLFKIAFRHH